MKAFKRPMHALWYPNYPCDGSSEPVSGKKTLSFVERSFFHEIVFVMGMIPYTDCIGEAIRRQQSSE